MKLQGAAPESGSRTSEVEPGSGGAAAVKVFHVEDGVPVGIAAGSSCSGDAPLPVVAVGQITVTGSNGYPAWAFGQVFNTGQADLMQDDDRDGSSNLREYAFTAP